MGSPHPLFMKKNRAKGKCPQASHKVGQIQMCSHMPDYSLATRCAGMARHLLNRFYATRNSSNRSWQTYQGSPDCTGDMLLKKGESVGRLILKGFNGYKRSHQSTDQRCRWKHSKKSNSWLVCCFRLIMSSFFIVGRCRKR